MRIIIEGCDKSGKSTLIEALKNQIPSMVGLKLLSKPADGTDRSKQYIKQMYIHMADMSRNQTAHYLFDRWYPSQMVYSFKRKHDDLDDPWFMQFEQELSKTPNLYILLDVDPDLIEKRFDEDQEKFAKKNEINKIKQRYAKHYKMCQLNKMIIDPTDRLDEAVDQIKKACDVILNPQPKDFTEEK